MSAQIVVTRDRVSVARIICMAGALLCFALLFFHVLTDTEHNWLAGALFLAFLSLFPWQFV